MNALIFLTAAGVLLLLGTALAWPADDELDHRRPAAGVRRSSPVTAVPEPPEPTRRAWVASRHESRWHAGSGTGVGAACGHSVRGQLQHRAGQHPPDDEVRSACAACLATIGYIEARPFRPPRPLVDAEPDWPVHDPDTPTDVSPRRTPALHMALCADEPHAPVLVAA